MAIRLIVPINWYCVFGRKWITLRSNQDLDYENDQGSALWVSGREDGGAGDEFL